MSPQQLADPTTATPTPTPAPAPAPARHARRPVDHDVDGMSREARETIELGFGVEFRELARQQRFRRSAEAAERRGAGQGAGQGAGAAPRPASRATGSIDDRAEAVAAPRTSTSTPEHRSAARIAYERRATERLRQLRASEAAAASRARHVRPAQVEVPVAAAAPRPRAPIARLTDDATNVLTEMARMADRVIESREALVGMTVRAERAELELERMGTQVMSARGLVQEAQRTATLANERAVYLEARCEALQDALDLALNASFMQRFRWRRSARRTQA